MTSGRGPQFTSVLWNDIADKLGISIHRTCAYHPHSNGLVERFLRSLNAALKARLHEPNWVDEIPWVLLGLRTVPKQYLETSSAELFYGKPLTLPGKFINPDTNHLPVANIPFQTIFQKVTPTSHHGTITPHLSPTIKRCTIRLHPPRWPPRSPATSL